ncbi:MAG: biotin/lipoyl-binding protein [Candidatus Nanopelagicales bacterium]|nr:biotin/lipoyl-binding protein [Candidatus Nanopelagicales bacterium]
MGLFKMPSLGADMDEGTLLEWLVKPGDAVHKGDVVAVIDTAKSAIDVEVFEDGFVGELLIEPGTLVPVGTPWHASTVTPRRPSRRSRRCRLCRNPSRRHRRNPRRD